MPGGTEVSARSVMAGIDNPQLAPHARKALDNDWVRPNKRIFNNAKVSDHFAIVPTGTEPKNLSEPEQKIFDMVSRRFVAVFFPNAQFEVTTRITIVEQERFKTDGKVIVAPGTRINPLDTVSLSKSLLFIDARDAPQLARAKQLVDEPGSRIKVILTAGSYLDLMRRWQRPVFFDQEGRLTAKLGIRHVPALVSQEGSRLRIDELL